MLVRKWWKERAEMLADELAEVRWKLVVARRAEVLERGRVVQVEDARVEQLRELARTAGMLDEKVEGATFDEVRECVRIVRVLAEKMRLLQSVLAGEFEADEALLRKLAAGFGMSTWAVKDVVARGSVLAGALGREKALERELGKARARIEELRDELDDLG